MATKRKTAKPDATAPSVKENKYLFIGIDLGTNHTVISTRNVRIKKITRIKPANLS